MWIFTLQHDECYSLGMFRSVFIDILSDVDVYNVLSNRNLVDKISECCLCTVW